MHPRRGPLEAFTVQPGFFDFVLVSRYPAGEVTVRRISNIHRLRRDVAGSRGGVTRRAIHPRWSPAARNLKRLDARVGSEQREQPIYRTNGRHCLRPYVARQFGGVSLVATHPILRKGNHFLTGGLTIFFFFPFSFSLAVVISVSP